MHTHLTKLEDPGALELKMQHMVSILYLVYRLCLIYMTLVVVSSM